MIGRSIVDTTVRSSAATNTLNPTTIRIVRGAIAGTVGSAVGAGASLNCRGVA
jgi:hypothetical protein